MSLFDQAFDREHDAALVTGAGNGGLALTNWFDPPEFD